MTDFRHWVRDTTGRRITATDIATALNISRTSATRRLVNSDFSASEIIRLCHEFGISPLLGLVQYDFVTDPEIWDYLESEGQLVETAEDGDLALELARRLNPATKASELDELAARRSRRATPDDTVTELDARRPSTPVVAGEDEDAFAADSSPDEREERYERGEDPID